VVNHLVIVLMVIVNACAVDIACNLNIVIGLLSDVQAVVSLVVTVAIRCVVLVSI